MTLTAPEVSVITDEISPVLDDAIRVVTEEGLCSVDLRVVDGVNFMALSPAAMKDCAQRLRHAGLTVRCLATPLLKWPAPGQPWVMIGDQFGFDPTAQTFEEAIDTALRAADTFRATRLRIFSYLLSPAYTLGDLRPAFDTLLHAAERAGLTLVLENEHVCNVATIPQLAETLAAFQHPRLRGILDIANAYAFGAPPTSQDVARAAPYIDSVHLKDFDFERRRFVTLGAGCIPFADLLRPIYDSGTQSPPLIVETHVPEDRMGATRASLRSARDLAARLAGPTNRPSRAS
jgi:sugar phosphate isomerase/epimerase